MEDFIIFLAGIITLWYLHLPEKQNKEEER